MMKNLWKIWIILVYVFFCNMIIVLYVFVLSHCIVPFNIFFLINRFLLVPYAYVPNESIDYILLSSLALDAILLTSSVNTSCFSLLFSIFTSCYSILCCNFNTNLLLFMNPLWYFLKLFMSVLFFSIWFISFSSWVFRNLFRISLNHPCIHMGKLLSVIIK